MIELARFLVPFFAPLPISIFCLVLTLFFMMIRMKKMAFFSLVMTLCLLIVLGYGIPTRQHLQSLERKYSPLTLEKISESDQRKIRFIVVLGSENITDSAVPESNQLSSTSLYRIVEGIRIQRELPQAFLVFSGGASHDTRANAVVAGNVAESLGVSRERMVIEERPRDTAEEARILQPMLKDMPFILVTSAAHMDRAMQLFQKAGTKPIAAPTDFFVKSNGQLTATSFVPTCDNFVLSERMIYAWLAQFWNSISQLIE
jgi:uncharacterized SAM-binding protein YcdF (DUF218 family)